MAAIQGCASGVRVAAIQGCASGVPDGIMVHTR